MHRGHWLTFSLKQTWVTILHLLRVVLDLGSNKMTIGKYDTVEGRDNNLTRGYSLCWCEQMRSGCLWVWLNYYSVNSIISGPWWFGILCYCFYYYLSVNFTFQFWGEVYRKQANMVAHTLVRAACSWVSHRIFNSYLSILNIGWLTIIVNFALIKKEKT